MAQPNDSILVTPGSGATVATASPGGSNTTEFQVNMLAASSGHMADTLPTYVLSIPGLDLAANRYHWELFNGSASTTTLTVRSIRPVPNMSQNLIQPISGGFYFFRTTAVSSGGTAGTFESLLTTAANISKFNPNDSTMSSAVSAKTVLTSITTGAYLFRTFVSISSSLPWNPQSTDVLLPGSLWGSGVLLPPAQGIAVRQDTVASSGTLGWTVVLTRDQ